MDGQLYEVGKGTYDFALEFDMELLCDWTNIEDYYFFEVSDTRVAVIYSREFDMRGLPHGFVKEWYEMEKRACTGCDYDIKTLDEFIDWSENGQPTCIDCGMPLFEYYRDGMGKYRCKKCHSEAYSKEEWAEMCENLDDECYWTSCR